MNGPDSGVAQFFYVTPGTSYALSADAMTPAADPLRRVRTAAYLVLVSPQYQVEQ